MRLTLPKLTEPSKVVHAPDDVRVSSYYVRITKANNLRLLVESQKFENDSFETRFHWLPLFDGLKSLLRHSYANPYNAVFSALSSGEEVHEFKTRKELAEFILKFEK